MPTLKYDSAGRYRVRIILKGSCVVEGEIEFIPTMYKPKALTVESFIRQKVIKLDWALKIERVEIENLSRDENMLPLGFLKVE